MPFGALHVAARIPCQDLDRARRWYAEKLGLHPVEEREGGLRYLIHDHEFCLFASSGRSDGSFTQLAITVADIDRAMTILRERGVVFDEYDVPGLVTRDGVAEIDDNYPSKGVGERGGWFKDSEGNLIGIGQTITS